MHDQSTCAPQRAGIYCRLSYAPDGSLEKVERQEADCRELATRLRWAISERHVFVDNARSAWQRNRKRPSWEAMLAAVEAGEIDAIIVYHGDRLIRQPFDLEKLINVADRKALRIASPSGTRNLDSADDRFILRIEAAQACRESDNLSRRRKRAYKALAAKGGSTQGGKRPYGWGAPTERTVTKVNPETGEEYQVPIRDYDVIVPEEARHLKEVVARILAGLSVNGAVRYMNRVSTTTSGNPWDSRTLKKLLISPRMSGLIDYEGQLYEARWNPVISEEARQQLIALLAENRVDQMDTPRERRYLLSCIPECGRCGEGNHIMTKSHGIVRGGKRYTYRSYFCRSCLKISRRMEHLDAYVKGRTVELLNDEGFLADLYAAMDGDRPNLAADIAALERRKREVRDQLEHLADHPEVDAGLALRALSSFDEKVSALRAQLQTEADLRQVARLAGVSADDWDEVPIDTRATVIKRIFRIVLLPTPKRGPGFDTDSVVVERRPLRAADADVSAKQGVEDQVQVPV